MNVRLVQIALDEYDARMKEIGPCGDGYCLVTGKAKGMHTNGGCRCWKNPMKAQLVMLAARRLRESIESACNR